MNRGDWSRTGSSSILPAVEQSIDSTTKPEFAAGTDPAYIPGLTAPAPAVTGRAAGGPEPNLLTSVAPRFIPEPVSRRP